MRKYERCYKCIHCKPCSAKGGLSQDGVECSHFKDKSLFVELPCKAGDNAYHLTSVNTLEELEVAEIFDGKVCSISKEEKNLWIFARYDNGLNFWYTEKDIGRKLFLTKEDAEAKLKELQI